MCVWLPAWLPERQESPLPGGQRACELGALGGTRTPNLLIRRSGHIVQNRPLRSVCWADIPALSAQDRRCPAAWQQYWLQSLRSRYWSRPSVFQAGHIPSWRGSCECYALSLVAADCRWLLLLSPLLSTRRRPSVSKRPASCRGWPASAPGRLLPGPWFLAGGGAEAPRSRVAERSFPKETRSALDGGGVPPHPERAIPGP
jgi:hypothetical protein